LYATAPVRGVLGTCRLTEMDLPPGYVWSDPVLKAARITREDLATYGGNDPHLFDVSEPVPYGLCRPLADFGLTRPPQSWCYFPDEAVSHV
ncbi:MAG: hypothetical protein PHF83_07285, partial [Candidatus Methanomethylophilus sp.]|nr:hypothetical protein [Methanomethylophilus sp.]